MKKNLYEEGFLQLRRNLLSQPEMVILIAEEGWSGFGLYVGINLYLSHCEAGWGAYTGRQLSALAIQGKKHRSDVSRIITNYGLFKIDGSRFTSLWMQRQCGVDADKIRHSRANHITRAEEIEKDIEKEKKEKGGKVPDVIGPSAYERVSRAGLRHGHHGEPVPWWAPPQLDLRCVWSLCADSWVPSDGIDPEAERLRRTEMSDEDFMMKTAYERLTVEEQSRIQDFGVRG